MPILSRYKTTAKLAKALIPAMAPLVSSVRMQTVMSLAETGVAILQGKGAGSGWDMGAEISAALPFVFPGATVFDVGANKGEWSRAVRQRVGDVRLYLFEPQASCLPHLDLDGCSVVRAAVGERNGRMVLHASSDASGNASLHERRETYFEAQSFSSTPVEVISLDSFLARERIDRVDFMKMDIEGHELFALRGARQALDRAAIRAISFEFGCGNINSRTFFRDYWDLLTPCGYEIRRILPGGRTLPIERYDEELEHFRSVSNYIAVARSGRAA